MALARQPASSEGTLWLKPAVSNIVIPSNRNIVQSVTNSHVQCQGGLLGMYAQAASRCRDAWTAI